MENKELLEELKLDLYHLCLLDDSARGDQYFDGVDSKPIRAKSLSEVIDYGFPDAFWSKEKVKPLKLEKKNIKKVKKVKVLSPKEKEIIKREREELTKLNEELQRQKEEEKRKYFAKLEAERIAREKEEEEELFFSLEREKKNTEKATKYVNVALQEMRNGKAKREYGYGRLYINIENIKYIFYLSENKDILYIQPNVCQRFFYTGINDENVKAYKKYLKGGK